MGTRGAIGFRLNGKDKVSYNHFDSYPSGLGADVVEVLHKYTPFDMRQVVAGIRLVQGDSKPTPEDIEACKSWTDLGVSNQSTDDWYCLLRQAQGDLDAFMQGGLRVMIDSHEFLGDSLFCEWAYIVNLDDETLEVYKGFNQNRKAAGRYVTAGIEQVENDKYYGVQLLVTIPLETLASMKTSQFVKGIEALAYEREEEEE